MIFPNGSAEFWRIGACLLHFFFQSITKQIHFSIEFVFAGLNCFHTQFFCQVFLNTVRTIQRTSTSLPGFSLCNRLDSFSLLEICLFQDGNGDFDLLQKDLLRLLRARLLLLTDNDDDDDD